MSFSRWLKPPLRTLTGFVALVALLAVALGWLGWKVIESDLAEERLKAQQQLETSVELVNSTLQQQLIALERMISIGKHATDPSAPPLPPGVMAIRATAGSFTSRPLGVTLFLPISAQPDHGDPLAATFEEGDAAEFRGEKIDDAMRIYQTLVRSSKLDVRAEALARLARTQRRAGKLDAALATYAELGRLDQTLVFGVPATLQAAEGRGTILSEAGRTAALKNEAAHLQNALLSGRYPLDPAAWEFRMEEARSWGGDRAMTPAEQQALVLSRAADWVHQQWEVAPVASGRRARTFDSQSAIVIWVGKTDQLDAIIAGPEHVRAMLTQSIAGQPVNVTLTDENDRVIASVVAGDSHGTPRNATVVGTQWTIQLVSTDPGETTLLAGRRPLLISAVSVLGLVLFAGSFFIVRSIARERAVAKLQSEFVSTVSHEFRTPLTALRQLSEMLAKGRVPTEPQRQQAYDIMSNESERLHRLVESLLDFGRVRAGAFNYQFEAADAAAFVTSVVTAFRPAAARHGFEVDLQTKGTRAAIRADREALGLALGNLLDNAVKYSPDCHTVWVDMNAAGEQLTIRVRDQGIGIPAAEQRTIFNEFVRGTAGRDAGIKGTGIGLALARQIVIAHRGEILVESAPGAGSTFTIHLPLETA